MLIFNQRKNFPANEQDPLFAKFCNSNKLFNGDNKLGKMLNADKNGTTDQNLRLAPYLRHGLAPTIKYILTQ